jgi:hypothetical protein
MTNNETLQVLDHLVSEIGKALGDMQARIRALEDDEGISVIDEIDWERQYPDKTLGRAKNGLFQYALSEGRWHVVANGVADVKAEGGRFLIEMSDGAVIEREIAKSRRKVLGAVAA